MIATNLIRNFRFWLSKHAIFSLAGSPASSCNVLHYPSAARSEGTSVVLFGEQDKVATSVDPNGHCGPEVLIAFQGIYKAVRFDRGARKAETKRVARGNKRFSRNAINCVPESQRTLRHVGDHRRQRAAACRLAD